MALIILAAPESHLNKQDDMETQVMLATPVARLKATKIKTIQLGR
jgi:hypothetical protein